MCLVQSAAKTDAILADGFEAKLGVLEDYSV